MTIRFQFFPEGAAYHIGQGFPQYLQVQGTHLPVSGLAFDAAAYEAAYWKFKAVQYGSGNLTAYIYWYADTAVSGAVVWGATLAAITPDVDTQDVEQKLLAANQTVTDTHLGTIVQRLHVVALTISNLDGLAANDLVWLRIYRGGGDAGDTMAGDAILLMIELTYSEV